MRKKYARKLSFFIMWLLYVQLLRGKNRYGGIGVARGEQRGHGPLNFKKYGHFVL